MVAVLEVLDRRGAVAALCAGEGSSKAWLAEESCAEYWVMAEPAEQVDLRTLASAWDFSTAQAVICMGCVSIDKILSTQVELCKLELVDI